MIFFLLRPAVGVSFEVMKGSADPRTKLHPYLLLAVTTTAKKNNLANALWCVAHQLKPPLPTATVYAPIFSFR
jgi:hypothetical protein